MAISLNSGMQGTPAANRLNNAHESLTQSIERISTGRKINSASDDASGMAIADGLRSRALGMGQAMKNAADGISITQVADGALGEVSNIVTSIRTNALQAANAGQSAQSRQAIQADIDKSLEALDRLAETTSFNGHKLLSGNFSDKQFMVDPNSGETVDISISSAESTKLGSPGEQGTLSEIDVTTQEGAQNAVAIADEALKQVNGTRSDIGSAHNQLTSTVNNLSQSRINAFQAESGIRDTDIAEESMNMNRAELLLGARTFAQVQANASAKNVTNLLG
ncbi:MAG: flagellin [Desulfobacteraceae bacterium]